MLDEGQAELTEAYANGATGLKSRSSKVIDMRVVATTTGDSSTSGR